MTMLVPIRVVCLLSVLFAYAGARSLEGNFNAQATYGGKNATKETPHQLEGLHTTVNRVNRLHTESSHIRKRDVDERHEDLLELMVRIAETPEEWDRIHRILNELARDGKQQQNGEDKPASTPASNSRTNTEEHVSFNPVKQNVSRDVETHKSIVRKEEQLVETTTLSYSYQKVDKHKNKVTDKNYETSNDDSWPDFDEAIWNKKRWHFLPKIKNNDVNPFSGKWLETEYTGKQHLRHNKYEALDRRTNQPTNKDLLDNAESNEVPDSVDDVLDYGNEISDNSNSELWKDNYDSSLKDNSALPLENEGNNEDIKNMSQNMSSTNDNGTNVWNGFSSKSNKSHSNKPNFTYHRVTSSPRERHKVNAYIAVSVVRESKTVPQPSPTTAPTEAPWNHARHLHKLQEQLKSISAVKAKLRHHWLDKEYQHVHMNRGHYGHQHNQQNRTHH